MTDLDYTESVLADIRERRVAQYEKWGRSSHSVFQWLSILGEEFGEICDAVNKSVWGEANYKPLRDEIIDVAAVAVAMTEDLDDKQ